MAVALFALCLAVPAGAGAFGSTLQWKGGTQLMPLVKAQSGAWEGKLTVTDTEGFEKDKFSVECATDKLEGSAGAGGSGEITGLTVSGCIGVGTTIYECSKTSTGTTLKAIDLPWHTELVKSQLGPPVDQIVSGGKGTPGFVIKCRVFGVTAEDNCTGNLALNINKLEPAAGPIGSKEKLMCTLDKTATGSAEGTQTMSGANNIEEGTPVWNVSSEQPVNWSKGTLTVIDGHPGLGVTCEEAGEGTVSTAGAGSVSKVTLSKCTKAIESECTGSYAIEALHLPWKTQLYFGELEALDNLIAAGSSGAVAYKVKCVTGGFLVEDTCEASPEAENSGRLATELTNGVESGVKARYYNHQSLSCGRTGGSEIYESSHTIKLTGGGTLTVSG